MLNRESAATIFRQGLVAALTVMSLMTTDHIHAQDRSQARSMVISRYGIVAAESPLAAQAGAMVLERGGTAADAAVAANAMMGVVAPMSDGIGGDLFAIVYDAKSGKLYGLNASGWGRCLRRPSARPTTASR
jgi:gamma-glutamyltranspeptidase / glutathione hydrolase